MIAVISPVGETHSNVKGAGSAPKCEPSPYPRNPTKGSSATRLDVKSPLADVAVLHHILLALHAGLALGTSLSHRSGFDEIGE